MPWFESDAGNRLWYEEHGVGTPIVFIHGWCMTSAVWGLQLEYLSDSFRVITIDLRGHGNSPLPSDGFHISGCAADIHGLFGYLDIYDAILVGWSLGALIAIESCLLCNRRLSGLVLISGTPQFVQSADFPYGLSRAEADGMAKKVQRNIGRALEGFFTRMLASGEAESAIVHGLLSSIAVPPADVALQALGVLVETNVRDRLAKIDVPTLIMYGDSDVICLPEASEFMSRQIPLTRQVVFSGCGHVPFLTQSRKFNECLDEFRGRVCSENEYRQK